MTQSPHTIKDWQIHLFKFLKINYKDPVLKAVLKDCKIFTIYMTKCKTYKKKVQQPKRKMGKGYK